MLKNSRGRFAWPPLNCYDGSDLNTRVFGRRVNAIDNKRLQRRPRASVFEVVNHPRGPAEPKRYRGQCPDDCARNHALEIMRSMARDCRSDSPPERAISNVVRDSQDLATRRLERDRRSVVVVQHFQSSLDPCSVCARPMLGTQCSKILAEDLLGQR